MVTEWETANELVKSSPDATAARDIAAVFLFEQLRNFQHLLRPGTDPVVFCQVEPAHRA
jgi:hypothetical protein